MEMQDEALFPCSRCGDTYRIPPERAAGYICPICAGEMSGMDPIVTSATRLFRCWVKSGMKVSITEFQRAEQEYRSGHWNRCSTYGD